MKLAEVFKLAEKDGYTHATDCYSYFGRKLKNWIDDEFVKDNQEDWKYCEGMAMPIAEYPSNQFRFWKQ